MTLVIIPTPLRKFTNNLTKVMLSTNRLPEVIPELTRTFPSLKKYLLDSEGKTTSFINIYVDSEDIRNLPPEQTELHENTVISIVPAIAGGNYCPIN